MLQQCCNIIFTLTLSFFSFILLNSLFELFTQKFDVIGITIKLNKTNGFNETYLLIRLKFQKINKKLYSPQQFIINNS